MTIRYGWSGTDDVQHFYHEKYYGGRVLAASVRRVKVLWFVRFTACVLEFLDTKGFRSLREAQEWCESVVPEKDIR